MAGPRTTVVAPRDRDPDGRTPLALVGGRVIPVCADPIDRGVVIVSAGRIIAVGGPDTSVPDGALVVDTTGCQVLPGFIDAHTHIGTLEEGVGWAGDDHDESTAPVTAQLRALDAINPLDIAFADAVAGGVLAVGVNPGSCNPIGGQTAALRTAGRTVDEMVLKAPAGMKSALGENPKKSYGDRGLMPSTRMGVAAVIRQAMTQAAVDLARSRSGGDPDEPVDLGRRALMQVLTGDLPWRQHVHRADDIATAIRLADEFGYRLVIDHGTEAHLLADVIAQRGIPVLLGPLIVGRGKVELRHRAFANAATLAAAGVEISLVTDHPVVPIELARVQAALAVRDGLPARTALLALTLHPARALGVADRIGSLKPGLDADLCVWTGDPLELGSVVLAAYSRGRQVLG
jgi:imidazolonepropionase-like amidohydrolase